MPVLPRFEKYSKYLAEMDSSGVYSNNGPLVKRLENEYAKVLGLENADLVVLCASATIGLQGFMQLSHAANWHISTFTFPATIHAAIQSGKGVILEDINPETWVIAPESISNNSTEGILPVLPFGADFEASSFSHLDNVLIDAAASIGGAKNWISKLREN
jgi:dTDP-4-amino-4,6-dideoxygalactose transaminase